MLPYQTLIILDPTSRKSQYQQIVDQILNCIKKGVIHPGVKLPSSRILAGLLSVHRKTVIAAYDELINQGWVIPKTRSGYYINAEISISDTLNHPVETNPFPEKFPGLITERYGVDPLPVRSDLDKVYELFIDDGLPDARIAPFETLLKEYKYITQRNYKLKNINTGSLTRSLRLKESIVTHLSGSRGFLPKVSNVLITNGAQMGIYLTGQALLGELDTVIVGSPCYDLAQYSFQNQGANIIEVPVDADGIDTAAIEDICKQQTVKAVYVVPHHHYPTTATLSPQRRLKLISMASAYNFFIIEDDYDYDFHYSSAPHLPMVSYPHAGRVIYIASLSKSFSASLRLGFVAASPDLIAAMAASRRNIDIRGDFLLEEAVAAMIENGEMYKHLKRSVKIYKERRDLLCNALHKDLKLFVTYAVPAGGLAVWIEVAREYDVDHIADVIKKKDILLHPKLVFGKRHNLNHMRIGFASIDAKEISMFVKAMQYAFHNYHKFVNEKQT